MSGCPIHHHGVSKAMGCKHLSQSNFSKMFPQLPGLAVSEQEAAILGGPGGIMHDFDDSSPDCGIPAGYTFFAQFVDHDITLDVESKLHGEPLGSGEIGELPNLRTPSLDLDCVYGMGPEASPHLYDPSKPGRLAAAEGGMDLARSPAGVALIGDPRNDENIFVSQMQLLMIQFHNKLFERREHGFEKAQEATRYHYQWIVLFDFLKRLCDPKIYQFAVPKILSGDKAFPFVFMRDGKGKPVKASMPVEISVAAYRVGHTLVRSTYTANEAHDGIELFDPRFGTNGFTAVPDDLFVDWRFMLPVADCTRPLMSKAVDPLLTDELQNLPVVGSRNPNDRALAFRNLLRGNVMSLPCGQAVRDALKAAGYPIANHNLKFSEVRGWERLDALKRKPSLREETPLFYYLLRESEVAHNGQRFGPTGSALLLEFFGGMLLGCGTSFLSRHGAHRDWQPDPCVSKESCGWWSKEHKKAFDKASLVKDPDLFPLELADVVRFVRGIER